LIYSLDSWLLQLLSVLKLTMLSVKSVGTDIAFLKFVPPHSD
jgi:hypothetical protein